MTQRELAESLLELTEAIQHAAQLADWPEAARLTEQRASMLMSLTRDVDEAALAMIRRIQAMDRSLIDDARTTQAELTAEYELATRRIKSAQQYNRVAMF